MSPLRGGTGQVLLLPGLVLLVRLGLAVCDTRPLGLERRIMCWQRAKVIKVKVHDPHFRRVLTALDDCIVPAGGRAPDLCAEAAFEEVLRGEERGREGQVRGRGPVAACVQVKGIEARLEPW